MSLPPNDEPPLPEAIWNLLRRDEPEPHAIHAAYQRFITRRPEAVSPFRVARWLLVGFVAGGSVAFAATGAPLLGARFWPHHLTARDRSTAPAIAHSPVKASPPAARDDAPLAEPSAVPLRAPLSDSLHPIGEAPHAILPDPAPTDPKWQRAAGALKARDYVAAERVLREVETTGMPSDRDAASLALAQVLLTRGRTVEARARLERLTQRAGSALVREKAAALLADPSAPAERSFPLAPVPQ